MKIQDEVQVANSRYIYVDSKKLSVVTGKKRHSMHGMKAM